MPGLAQVEAIAAQLRRASFQVVGEPSARGCLVEDRDGFDVVLQRGSAASDGSGELVQDPLLLLQRARLGDGELVPELDELLRLDEQRLSRIRRVVDDPGQVRSMFRSHREHVAVAAHRVVQVAQHRHHVLVLQHLLDALLDRAVEPAGPLPQLRE